uniref:UDP-glucuronosyltransferase n=2 Tax=Cacopsylla melanoneura TaxID=428564 RepID=A0A8D9BS66_9HEMI
MKSFLWIFTLICLILDNVRGFRILVLCPHISRSHFTIFEAIAKGLTDHGHVVDVLSHFPQNSKVLNYNDISVAGSMKLQTNDLLITDISFHNPVSDFFFIHQMGEDTCNSVMSTKAALDLLHSNKKYDLIITEVFNTDCFLGFVHKFKAPFIAVSAAHIIPMAAERFGIPDNPSYIPNAFLSYDAEMNFVERFLNTVTTLSLNLMRKYYYDPKHHKVATRYFGDDLPPFDVLARNTSLVLVNSHFSFMGTSRPYPSNVIEVAGLHVKSPQPLPADIRKFLDESKNGVIYFSMGSIIQGKSFPTEKRKAFLRAFEQVPQRVIWKWEGENMSGKIDSILLKSWAPQRDILDHPNVKVFISHGGFLGTTEALYSGVPIIGIPMFGDQKVNIRQVEKGGYGVTLPYNQITEDTVLAALRKVLKDKSFKKRAEQVARLFQDRPMPPLDTAIYWIEHAIRHGGGAHLKPASLDLYWWQYVLLDVIFVLLLIPILIFLFIRYFIRYMASTYYQATYGVDEKKRN